MTFHVGQQVECIVGKVHSSYERAYSDENWPSAIKSGGIYTVRDVDTRASDCGWPITLRFQEYYGRVNFIDGMGEWELGFPGDLFRPVVFRKTDISIFTDILARSSTELCDIQ